MSKILKKTELVPKIHEFIIETPNIARKAQPGHFVVVMADETGERIPLTIADFDRERGTITLVLMVVGTSSMKLAKLEVGDSFHALIGPLGEASEVKNFGTAIVVAGGLGTAPVFPIARGLKEAGCKVITIQGSRSKDLLFWEDRLAEISEQHIVTTDDGSAGRKALVTEPLKELLEADTDKQIGCVYAIGPAIMMKFACETTRPFGVRTIASLNSVMVDGTGMCGGCRVDIGGETKFTCVVGPEFDGHLVDWDLLLTRQRVYHEQEQCSLNKYVKEYESENA
jgi:ferredoxin--NADP+ reductase